MAFKEDHAWVRACKRCAISLHTSLLASGARWPQPVISSRVRKQPSHKPVFSAMRHTEMQGELGSSSSSDCKTRSACLNKRNSTGESFGGFGLNKVFNMRELCVKLSGYPARLFNTARATKELGWRPKAWLIKAPASINASKSIPVSMPMSCIMYTTSSVATLPVAPLA